MSENSIEKVNSGNEAVPRNGQSVSLQFLMREFGESQSLSPEQLTAMIEERRLIIEYTHAENMQKHEEYKIKARDTKQITLASVGFLSLIFISILAFKPEFLSQVITGIMGFLGGSGLGYYLKSSEEEKKD